MDEEFRVDSPDGMLTFFVRATEDVHRYVSRLTGGDVQLTEDIVQKTFGAKGEGERAPTRWIDLILRA